MILPIKIAFLPIGKFWDESIRRQLELYLSELPERFQVLSSNPVIEEIEILKEIEKILPLKPDIILLGGEGSTRRNCKIPGTGSKKSSYSSSYMVPLQLSFLCIFFAGYRITEAAWSYSSYSAW